MVPDVLGPLLSTINGSFDSIEKVDGLPLAAAKVPSSVTVWNCSVKLPPTDSEVATTYKIICG